MRNSGFCCFGRLALGLLVLMSVVQVGQAQEAKSTGVSEAAIRAEIWPETRTVLAGRPAWALLTLTNLSAEPVKLEVPGTAPSSAPVASMGLPLSHVFSGPGSSALSVLDEYGVEFGTQAKRVPAKAVPPLTLAPQGSAGIRLDLTRYYTALTRPGVYSLCWHAYGGSVKSVPLELKVIAEQRAVIVTDVGDIVMRFYYDEAPNHVQNFLELARQGFYDNLTFHRLVPGGLVQGGDPRGDGRGIRPDGRRLKAEFSSIPFVTGTVGMARSPRDPDSGSCQFFICLARQPSLDGHQTAFGQVVGEKSFETLKKIAAVPVGPKDRPIEKVYIRAISLENVSQHDRGVGKSPLPSVSSGTSKPLDVRDERFGPPLQLGREPEPAADSSKGGSVGLTTRPASSAMN